MIKQAVVESASRSQALASVWELLGAGNGPALEAMRIRLDNASAYKLVRQGISSKVVAPLGEFLGLGKTTIAAYLDLDRSTTSRRAAKDQVLPTHAAEGVVRLLELDQMACDTFESDAEASGWLRQPHPMLDGETPLEAAKTGYGAQRVKDILLAIKYGGVVCPPSGASVTARIPPPPSAPCWPRWAWDPHTAMAAGIPGGRFKWFMPAAAGPCANSKSACTAMAPSPNTRP